MEEIGEFYHTYALFNMVIDIEEKMNIKFMHEAMEKWGGSLELPLMIKTHQDERWFDILRSN